MKEQRGGWGSNLGFLMAAVGSAVGLGNIWGFPYKMGASGGFAFLVVYIVLALLVGLVIMLCELSIGRSAQKGVAGSYAALLRKGKPVTGIMGNICGVLAILAPFLIMSFYSVLGGYCMFYVVENFAELLGMGSGLDGSAFFSALLTNQLECFVCTLLFMVICYLIVRGGIKGGIEKFNSVAMPALAVMMVVVIIRSITLPGAVDGLKFMFVPGYAVAEGLIEEAPSFITVLAAAGGQMFFSLSLAMGAMITYGSYLSKKESLVKNSLIIMVADTCVALMAGLAVIPAAFALGGEGAAMQGPMLLFVTLQNVFQSMGMVGAVFGVLFYGLVLIAAISSAISLMEVLTTFVVDRATSRGKEPNRSRITAIITLLIMVESSVVALDGLGSNGLPTPMGFIWLDFFDLWAEGIAMPLGALLMSILMGWFIEPDFVKNEVSAQGNTFPYYSVFRFLLRFVVPIAMVFILIGQLDAFFAWNLF